MHPSITKLNGAANDTVSVSDYGDADDKTEVEVKLGKDDVNGRGTVGPKVDSGVASADSTEVGSPQDDPLGTYVGSATWEERTWKEITRLREDMFWARFVAVRS